MPGVHGPCMPGVHRPCHARGARAMHARGAQAMPCQGCTGHACQGCTGHARVRSSCIIICTAWLCLLFRRCFVPPPGASPMSTWTPAQYPSTRPCVTPISTCMPMHLPAHALAHTMPWSPPCQSSPGVVWPSVLQVGPRWLIQPAPCYTMPLSTPLIAASVPLLVLLVYCQHGP